MDRSNSWDLAVAIILTGGWQSEAHFTYSPERKPKPTGSGSTGVASAMVEKPNVEKYFWKISQESEPQAVLPMASHNLIRSRNQETDVPTKT